MKYHLDTINSIFRFFYSLRYDSSSCAFVHLAQGNENNRDLNLLWILNSTFHPNYHKFRSLTDRVRQLGSEHEGIKAVWSQFVYGITKRDTSTLNHAFVQTLLLFPPDREHLGIFSDTDLIVYPDHAGVLPINGIRKKEIGSLIETYARFMKSLVLDCSKAPQINIEDFAKQIGRDVRTLMSIPLGRELIQRILIKNQLKIFISIGDECSYSMHGSGRKFHHHIIYSLEWMNTCHEMPGGLMSLYTPFFMALAHELIHLLHQLDGTMIHQKNPKLQKEFFEDEEEAYTILNQPCCALHQPDRCNEETLRMQLDLPVRKTHISPAEPLVAPKSVQRGDHPLHGFLFERSLSNGAFQLFAAGQKRA